MSLARDMETLARAGDQYRRCDDCSNAYHINTPDGFLISGYGRCVSCEWLVPRDNASADRVMSCVSTIEPYIRRDGSTGEQMRVNQVWVDESDVWQVTLGSSVNQGATVMKLTDFYLQYKLDRSKESDQELPAPLASNGVVYYYVTYSFSVGRKKTQKRTFAVISVNGSSIFSLSALQKRLKNDEQKQTGLKVDNLLIENWIKINEDEYKGLMSEAV